MCGKIWSFKLFLSSENHPTLQKKDRDLFILEITIKTRYRKFAPSNKDLITIAVSILFHGTGCIQCTVSQWWWWLSQTHKRFKIVPFIRTKQNANFQANPLYQATKRHLNNNQTVKNDEKWDVQNGGGGFFLACQDYGESLATHSMPVHLKVLFLFCF